MRKGITPSDIDLTLDQDGWSQIVEAKPINARDLKGLNDYWSFYRWQKGRMTYGQKMSLQDKLDHGIMVCVSYCQYVKKPGYELINYIDDEGYQIQGVKGPVGGTDFAQPYRHIPLVFDIWLPHKEMGKLAAEYLESVYFAQNSSVQVLRNCFDSAKFTIFFPRPMGDCTIEDLENEKFGGCFFQLSTFFAGFCPYKDFRRDPSLLSRA